MFTESLFLQYVRQYLFAASVTRIDDDAAISILIGIFVPGSVLDGTYSTDSAARNALIDTVQVLKPSFAFIP